MFSIENVKQALNEFYGCLPGRDEAHLWLNSFQTSSSAWPLCWELLDKSQPDEVQFFAANTIQNIISKQWHQIPMEQIEHLKRKIIDYVLIYASGPKIISVKLSIILSAYILRTINDHWTTAIADIILNFKPEHFPHISAEHIIALPIEILAVLPEEFQNVVLPSDARGLTRLALHNAIPLVLNLIVNVIASQSSPAIRAQTIKCISSWVIFGIPLPDCEPLFHPLLAACKEDEIYHQALDCLSLICCHPDADKYDVTLQRLLHFILELGEELTRHLEEKNMEKYFNFFGLFTTVGETHCKLLLKNILRQGTERDDAIRYVEIIFKCSSVPGQYPVEESCSTLPFNFWYSLHDEIVNSDPREFQVYKARFDPVFFNLVDIMISKSVLPTAEAERDWDLDEIEYFRVYRQDIADTMMYCYSVLREPMLAKLLALVVRFYNQALEGDREALKFLEASLFAFESVAESVDLMEEQCLPVLFSYMPAFLNLNDEKVAGMTIASIGAYCGWVRLHPDALPYAMLVLNCGFQNDRLLEVTSIALKEISRECQNIIKPFADQLLIDMKNLLLNLEKPIKATVRARVIGSISRLLSILDYNFILSYLNDVLTPFINELERLAAETPSEETRASFTDIFTVLSVLSSNLDTKAPFEEGEAEVQMVCDVSNRLQPLVPVMQRLLPIFHRVAIKWIYHESVIDHICDILKKSISTLLDDCLPLMSDILEIIISLYQIRPAINLLDLVKQFILLFGNDETHLMVLKAVLLKITQVTASYLENNYPKHTDLVQGYLQTLAQVLKKTNILQDQAFNLTDLFRSGLIGMSLPEAYTVKSASTFLVTFINKSVERDDTNLNPSMTNIVHIYGESLVDVCLKCIRGDAPRGIMDHISELLISLSKHYFPQLCQWMNVINKKTDLSTSKISQDQIDHYTRQILQERVNKRKLQEIIKQYSLACRGLLGTAYGDATRPCL